MQRRKFLATVGGLAAGSAAAIGTGAMTSTRAVRQAKVDIVGDKAAYLALKAQNPHVGYSGGTTMKIDLASSTSEGGTGVNDDAEIILAPAFTVKNQYEEDVYLEIDNPLSNLDMGTEGSGNAGLGDNWGGENAPAGVDVQFIAVDDVPASEVALIDRAGNPTGLGGGFGDINSNEMYPGNDNPQNENKGGSYFNIENDKHIGAIDLPSGNAVDIVFRIVTNGVDDSFELDGEFTLEAYSEERQLTYDLVDGSEDRVL